MGMENIDNQLYGFARLITLRGFWGGASEGAVTCSKYLLRMPKLMHSVNLGGAWVG